MKNGLCGVQVLIIYNGVPYKVDRPIIVLNILLYILCFKWQIVYFLLSDHIAFFSTDTLKYLHHININGYVICVFYLCQQLLT